MVSIDFSEVTFTIHPFGHAYYLSRRPHWRLLPVRDRYSGLLNANPSADESWYATSGDDAEQWRSG
jgi:hypothetical protein